MSSISNCSKWANKVRYRNYDDAKRAAELSIGSKPTKGIPKPYKCKYCKGYHVGHTE